MSKYLTLILIAGCVLFGCSEERNPVGAERSTPTLSEPTVTPTVVGTFTATATPTITQVVIVFPDANLEAAVRVDILKPTGPIYNTDLLAMTGLHGQSKGIVDLTGLEYAINMQFVELTDNSIVDISVLEFMPLLTDISLNSNQIVEVTALVNNAAAGGIGSGFSCLIGLMSNPLSAQATTVDIPYLRTFNITVNAP